MSTKLIGTNAGNYVFPVVQGQELPLIGTGFDLVEGNPMSLLALKDNPPMESKSFGPIANSQYCSIYDNSTFQVAVDFDANTSGGGLGVQSGMCIDASTRVNVRSTSFIIEFNGAETNGQATVNSNAGLENGAQDLLDKGQYAEFFERYGTHFVAGYLFGKSCKASYNLQFSSKDMVEKFTASFTESAATPGFSEDTAAKITSAFSASHTTANLSASQRSLGFNAPIVSDITSLRALIDAYGNSSSEKGTTPISILVMPWQYIAAIADKINSGINCDDIETVTKLMNCYIYIKNTADKFIDDQLYTGATQYKSVAKVESDAKGYLEALNSLITSAVAKSTKINVSDTDPYYIYINIDGEEKHKFPKAVSMLQALENAVTYFVLSWKAWVKPPREQPLSTTMRALDGTIVPVSSDGATVDGSAGTRFTWSIDGNDNWEGTKNTQSMSYAIASFPDGWNMAIVLDRSAGTLQCVGRGVGQTLPENPRSEKITIRGNNNAKPCTDPTSLGLIDCNLQGGNYLICPM